MVSLLTMFFPAAIGFQEGARALKGMESEHPPALELPDEAPPLPKQMLGVTSWWMGFAKTVSHHESSREKQLHRVS